MTIGIAAFGVSALAGILSTLSPCVVPLIPVLMSTAVTSHRAGPYALAAGVALSFTVFGTLVAAAGSAFGLGDEGLRQFGAILLLAAGLVLLSGTLQAAFSRATAGVSNSGHALLARLTPDGLLGQFLIGSLLGVVWSPCVGPTLGAAATLASQGRSLGTVFLLMLFFGVGASIPLLAIGSLSRAAVSRSRGSMIAFGMHGRRVLGLGLAALAILILTHRDHSLEAWLLDHSPTWLTTLTTWF